MNKIKAVWFHSSIPVPGLSDITTSINESLSRKLKLDLDELGLHVESLNGKVKAFIPVVNIKSVLFGELEPEPAIPKVRLK